MKDEYKNIVIFFKEEIENILKDKFLTYNELDTMYQILYKIEELTRYED